ncbi:MAG TPA: hypothetical protein VG734_12870 [Lacunisphaera sp.]|nr:hypothetical protein [Lacunisphaera sp.]
MSRLALIGDFNPDVIAHRVIPQALDLAARAVGVNVTWDWVGTDAITDAPGQLAPCAGVWCVPGSPYRSMAGALAAIRFARETRRPFLGTCGGFQHALLEIARDVLGIDDADHAETNPAAPALVVTPLACSLVGEEGDISFLPGSQLQVIFNGEVSREGYHCNYGPNPDYRRRFEAAGLRFTGFDAGGQIRACELEGHPFFIGTLFQPERSVLAGRQHPLVQAFVAAAAAFQP